MQTPASRYQPSARPHEGLDELEYPAHDWTAIITTCGRLCYQRRKISVNQVFAGQKVGVKQVEEHVWLVTVMHYDLGYFDDETGRLEPIDKSLWSETVTHVSGMKCYLSLRNGPLRSWLLGLDSNQQPSG
jgi:putative transposase